MSAVQALALLFIGVGAAATLVRLVRGPRMLDRAVAVDTMTALVMCGLGISAVTQDDYTVVPDLLVLSLLGFVGSVSLARFFAGRSR